MLPRRCPRSPALEGRPVSFRRSPAPVHDEAYWDRYFAALAAVEYIDGKLIYREQIRHGFSINDKQAILAAIKDDEIAECPLAKLP